MEKNIIEIDPKNRFYIKEEEFYKLKEINDTINERIDEDNEKLVMAYLKNTDEEVFEYLVRGAKLRCDCGSHMRRLNLTLCHGVYFEDKPLVHDKDCKPVDEKKVEADKENESKGKNKECEKADKGNIRYFGVCNGLNSQALTEKIRLRNQLPDGTYGMGTIKGKKCKPDIIGYWKQGYYYNRIGKNNRTLFKDLSFLVCRYGGLISAVTSGQEYEDKKTENDKKDEKTGNTNQKDNNKERDNNKKEEKLFEEKTLEEKLNEDLKVKFNYEEKEEEEEEEGIFSIDDIFDNFGIVSSFFEELSKRTNR